MIPVPWLIGLSALTVSLLVAFVGYLVVGMINWGRTTQSIVQLSKAVDEMRTEMRTTMVTKDGLDHVSTKVDNSMLRLKDELSKAFEEKFEPRHEPVRRRK